MGETRVPVLGVDFDSLSMDEARDAAMALIAEGRGAYAVTPNPEIVWLCRKNPALLSAVRGADLVLPDGIGVVYAARILGRPLKQKVPGADFALEVLGALARTGGSAFLLGAKPGVAQLAADRLGERFPGLRIAGALDGYFADDGPVAAAVAAAKPDFLLVCLGSPKQELWMRSHAGKLNAGLMAGLGGSLDAFAGTVRRAPEKWQKLGLEWLYRLLREPRRLGRMWKLPLFLLAAVGERLFQREGRGT